MAASNSTASLAELRLAGTKLRQGTVAKTTIRGYAFDWRLFERWCAGFELAALPASPETVALFVTAQLTSGKKITTARRRAFAVAFEHRRRGLPCPCRGEVQQILTGAQRLRGEKPRQMRPITVRELRQVSSHLARLGSAMHMRNRAILVIGFASALRQSNIAALNLADVQLVRQGLILRIDREKQDQEGVGRLVALPRGNHPHTDPVRVLKGWLKRRGGAEGPLFPRLDVPDARKPLDPESICRIVKHSLRSVGISEMQRGAHSLRSGLITAAAEANISSLRISAFTGQSPEMVRRYFRRSELWRNNVCGKLGL